MTRETTTLVDERTETPLTRKAPSLGGAEALFTHRRVMWVLLSLGVALRIRQYLADRSLWIDESLLVPNLIHRSFAALLQPLENSQVAPVGFLFAERLAVTLFGTSGYALRLFPLLSGLASLFLFWKLAERILPRLGSAVALALFAVSGELVYYASETKQYSSDVTVALCVLSLAASVPMGAGGGLARWALAAAGGALAVWFSHPVVFVLSGIGLRWLWVGLRRGEWGTLARSAATCAVWAASFAVSYLVSLSSVAANESLRDYWQHATAPIPPRSLADLFWYVDAVNTISSLPLGHGVSEMVTLFGVLGGIALFARNRDHACWLIGPGVLALLASSAHKYPLVPRLWLFMVPALLLLVAAGADKVWTTTRKALPLLGPVFMILLFASPVLSAGHRVLKPKEMEEIRPLLEYILQHHQDGDVVYVYYSSEYVAQYYAERGLRIPGEVIVGVDARANQAAYAADVEKLRGKDRVWFLFGHVYKWGPGLDEEKLILHYADRVGSRLTAQRRTGASLYLYDLR
jgi:hypothetical protein